MREVKYGAIMNNAARLAGFDPAAMAVPDRLRVTAAYAVNAGLRRLYAEKFGFLKRIEWRRYRPTWTAQMTGWAVGMECWYGSCYWRLESGTGLVEPGTSGSGWVALAMSSVSPFVAFDQPWEQTVMDPAGVDKEAFAFESDPKYHPEAAPVHGCGWFEEGVLLPTPAKEGVFCKFIPQAPRVSFVEWASTSAYVAGTAVYLTGTEDVYIALEDVATGGTAPNVTPAKWRVIRVQDAFEEYLTELAAAAILTEDQGKYQTQAAADRLLDELVGRFFQFSGEGRASVGRWSR